MWGDHKGMCAREGAAGKHPENSRSWPEAEAAPRKLAGSLLKAGWKLSHWSGGPGSSRPGGQNMGWRCPVVQDRRPASRVWLAGEERAGSQEEACSVTGHPAHPGTASRACRATPPAWARAWGSQGPQREKGSGVCVGSSCSLLGGSSPHAQISRCEPFPEPHSGLRSAVGRTREGRGLGPRPKGA